MELLREGTRAGRRVLFLALLAIPLLAADPRGHWTGTMAIPNQPVDFQVDLDNPGGHWVGSVNIPSRHTPPVFPSTTSSFSKANGPSGLKALPVIPPSPGSISEDGKSISGDFTAGGNPVPFSITRAGEPNVVLPTISHTVPDSFAGEWGGGIDMGTMNMRLILKITNGPAGATAVLISPDQGGSEIPVTSIETVAKKLTLKVSAVGGELVADLDADGTTLTGTWSQGGKVLPVTLKKSGSRA